MPELLEIDFKALAPETLETVIESFVLREGTDYGAVEASMESKVKAVRTQLIHGKAKLVFDTESETCSILLEQDFKKTQLSIPHE